MTAHQLAKQLLELPDIEVLVEIHPDDAAPYYLEVIGTTKENITEYTSIAKHKEPKDVVILNF